MKAQNATGQSECDDCVPGKTQGATGQSACEDRETRRFQGDTGKGSCDSCPAGTHAATKGATKCSECIIGKLSQALLLSRLSLQPILHRRSGKVRPLPAELLPPKPRPEQRELRHVPGQRRLRGCTGDAGPDRGLGTGSIAEPRERNNK